MIKSVLKKENDKMEISDFLKLKKRFEEADTDGKIDIYTTSEGLNREQYMALLKEFPQSELGRLEEALG